MRGNRCPNLPSASACGPTASAPERPARRLPKHYYQPQTSFSRVVMGAHAVTVAVELQKSGEPVRQAERLDAAAIPSRPRRARHLIETAPGR